MATRKPTDLNIQQLKYSTLIDTMFPEYYSFAIAVEVEGNAHYVRDDALSNSYIRLIQLLDAQDTNFQNALAAKVDKEEGKGLSTEDFTIAEKQKLASLNNYDDTELRSLIAALSNYDDTEIRSLIAALESNKLNKSDIIKKADILTNLTNDTKPATVAAIMEIVGDIDYSSFLKISDVQQSLSGDSNLPPSVEAVTLALSNYILASNLRNSLAAISPEEQEITNTKVPTVGAVREAIDRYIPLSDKRNILTAVSPEEQAITDSKVPTVGAVRAALNDLTPPSITIDSTFDAISENPLQNKVITNKIQSTVSDSYDNTKLPTIRVVSSLISSAISTAIAPYVTTDEHFKVEQLSDSINSNKPLLLAKFNNSTIGPVTDTGYYNNQIYFNAATGELTAPSVVQTHSGNYYITSGTDTPDNDASLADFGRHEVYIQYN